MAGAHDTPASANAWSGAWPFRTRHRFRGPDGRWHVWQSRHHRKGLVERHRSALALAARPHRWLWSPRSLNWWIGAVFAIGALLFALGSVIALAPEALGVRGASANPIYFCGSIPFTLAAWLQLRQAAGARRSDRRALIGPWSRDAGWLSCALQFGGTVLFNVNTFDGMLTGLDWLGQDLAVWAPDAAGSVLFLLSGYLAFIEVCHAYWAWRPQSISWWVTATNLLGCVAFMISACFAFVPARGPAATDVTGATAFTLAGAIGFLAGSLLMMIEDAAGADASPEDARTPRTNEKSPARDRRTGP